MGVYILKRKTREEKIRYVHGLLSFIFELSIKDSFIPLKAVSILFSFDIFIWEELSPPKPLNFLGGFF